MGGKSQFVDPNHANKSRKFSADKSHIDGLKVPRNSFEFPMEASQGYRLVHEDIPYSYQVKHHSMKMELSSPSETSMKTLIDEELSSRSNDKRNAPSVVARLMGLDTSLPRAKPVVNAKECKDERSRSNIPRKEPTEIRSTHPLSRSLKSFKQTTPELLPAGFKRDSSQHTKNLRSTKPQPREHPQEELLQEFKKDFVAWQASKAWDDSRTLDNSIRQVKDDKTLSQENLNNEKLARYVDSKRNQAHDAEPRYNFSMAKPKLATRQGGGPLHEGYASKQSQLISKDGRVLRKRMKANDLAHLSVARFDKKLDRSSSPARIVILKPSSQGNNDAEDSLDGSSKILEKKGSMEDFIEEVKERLRFEIQGKATGRRIGTESALSERSTDPKQIARHIAKKIRENVTRDLGTMSVRSEPAGLYTSEVQFNRLDHPEFTNRDTRIFLSERLKNVLTKETQVKTCLIPNGRSGTPSEKLEQHVLTGARICRKHEASEHTPKEVRDDRKDGFNLKNTVSNMRHNFSLNDELKKKKIQSVPESDSNEFGPTEGIETTPIVIIDFGVAQDNFTEVPPSPESQSSSSRDEFCRPGHPSPDSPLRVAFIEGRPSPQDSEESISDYPEPKSLSEKDESGGAEDVTIKEKHYQSKAVEVEGHPISYIREILLAAGLYEGQAFDQAFPRPDALRPISKWVFEKVEEAYNRNVNVGTWGSFPCCGDTDQGRKMIFDLVNEALPRVLRAPTTTSTFKKWVPNPNTTIRHGRQLLNDLLREIRMYTDPQVDESHSLRSIVAWDTRKTPWPSISNEDTEVMGREMECMILGELIDELVRENQCTLMQGW